MAGIAARVPFLRSLRRYRPADLGHDAVAGVLITATAIPLGVGFAQAAGLPAIVGLYTSMAPLIVYGLFGSSRHVKVGLDAAGAAMIGAVIVPLATVAGEVDTSMLVALATLVSMLTGVILLLAGLARAGFLAELLSLPLLIGYQAGIGVSVIIGQLPKLAGTEATGGSDVERLVSFIGSLGTAHGPTVLVALFSFATLLGLRMWRPRWPAAILVLVAATLASVVFDLAGHGVGVIGQLPSGLPGIVLPDWGLLAGQFWPLLGVAASLALVTASDVVIASRTFAHRGHYRVSANTDLAGLGLAEIAAGMTGAVPASASYVRTAIAEHSRSRSQVSAVIGGLLMAVVVAWGTGLLVAVPLAALGAICVEACLRLVDIPAIIRLWHQRATDGAIAVLTALLVIVTDPLIAIAAAAAFSVLTFLARTVRPDSARLGRRRGIDGWFPLDEFADAEARELDTVVFDWNGPLMFANVSAFRDAALRECGPGVRHLVVDGSAMYDIDPSALAVLGELVGELNEREVQLYLTAPPPDAMEQLRRAGFPATLGEGPRVFYDIDTALAALGKIAPPPGELQDGNGDGVFEYREGPGDAEDPGDPGGLSDVGGGS